MHRLKVSPEKCSIAKEELEYLGHRIQGAVTQPLKKHLQAIKDFEVPRTKKQLQSFLGTCNWVREFIPNMTHLTQPLTDLLKKNRKYTWTRECQEAFDNIKQEMSTPRTLHRPDFDQKFYLQVDASLTGLGSVLFQKDNEGQRKVISYASKSLTAAQKKYHINELEILGALFGLSKYKAYLQDKPFTLITDSASLYWLQKNKDSKSKLTRWALLLQEYAFDVEHCSGKNNQLADFLSRHPTQDDNVEIASEERLFPPEINVLTHDELYTEVQQAQLLDPDIQQQVQLWQNIQQRGAANNNENKFLQEHQVIDGIIYRLHGEDRKVVIPRAKMLKVMHHFHDETQAAHPGTDETTRAIQQFYHATNLQHEVQHYIKQCLICASVKTRQIQAQAPQKPHAARAPFEIVSIDTLGPYPETPRKHRYIIILEDIFTKWIEAKAVPRADITEIRKFLEEDIFPRFGNPKTIISDNGSSFMSNSYLRMCEERRIQPYYTAAYYQRENPVERKVQELKKTLKALLFNEHRRNNWDKQLPRALAILRARRNRATGETPAKALLGYDPPQPGHWNIPEYNRRRREPQENARERRRRIRAQEMRFKQQTYPEDPRPPVTFRVGDSVMVKDYRNADPFAPAWSGPHPVMVRRSPEIFEVDKNGRQFPYHVDQLRPAPRGNHPEDDAPPAWYPDVDEPPPSDPEEEDAVQPEADVQPKPETQPQEEPPPAQAAEEPSTSTTQTVTRRIDAPVRKRRSRLIIRDAPRV